MNRRPEACAESARWGWLARGRFLPRLVLLSLLAVGALGAETTPDFAKLAPVPPCAELVSAARTRQIPLDGIDSPGEASRLSPGDIFTGLVTLSEKGGRRTQWLFYVTALATASKQPAGKPREPLVLYSGRGTKLEYVSSPAQVSLRVLGPFSVGTGPDPRKPKDRTVSFSIDKGFLGLGLERAAALVCRAEQSNALGGFWFGSDRPNPTQMAAARKFEESLRLEPEDEHAMGGLLPALFSYGEIVGNTEELQDLMMKVVKKPSVWSVIGHLGVTANLIVDSKHVGPKDLTPWGWPRAPSAYHLPLWFELNNRLALTVTLVVTQPLPPLLACGGIVGMLAEKPGDPETYLTLRVIAARKAK